MTLTGVATPDGVSLLSKLKQPWYLICSFYVANAFSFVTTQREQKEHVVFTCQSNTATSQLQGNIIKYSCSMPQSALQRPWLPQHSRLHALDPPPNDSKLLGPGE